jgi:hypothetical protein
MTVGALVEDGFTGNVFLQPEILHGVIGMIQLSKATFPSANLSGVINCESSPRPVKGILVDVEIPPGVMAGDIVELTSQACSSLNGMGPIAGTEATFTQPVTQSTPKLQFNVGPYNTLIKPILDHTDGSGSLLVSYVVKRGPVIGTSPKSFVIVTLRQTDGEPCPE